MKQFNETRTTAGRRPVDEEAAGVVMARLNMLRVKAGKVRSPAFSVVFNSS